MARRAIIVACAALALLPGCSDDAPTAAHDPSMSVVQVEATGCDPTPAHSVGVVIEPDLVATVAHGVAGADGLVIRRSDGRSVEAEMIAIDVAMDAALLRVPGLGLAPVEFVVRSSGTSARAITFPVDRAVIEPIEIRRRVVVKTSDIYGDGEVRRPGLELTASVAPGDSGGAVVDPAGRLQGIVWATSRIENGRAWATEMSVYVPLLEAARARRPPDHAECP